jgi:sensor c-di-GMP phosphodiesterase-like protein
MPQLPPKKRISLIFFVLSLCSLAGAFSCYSLARELILCSAQTQLLGFSRESILKRDGFEDSALQALSAMHHSALPHCSPQDLDALRELVFKSGILHDAGWFEGKQIRCSSLIANNINKSINLQFIAKPQNEIAYYRSYDHFSIAQKPTVIVRMGDAYVNIGILGREFSGPSWVQYFGAISDIRGYANTPDFYSGPPAPHAAWIYTSPGTYHLNGHLYATACSTRNRICRTSSVPVNFILRSERVFIRTGIVLGGVLGALFASAILQFYFSRQTLESQLGRAIRKKQLYLQYQPIVRIADRRMVGAEALCRWKKEDGVPVPPQKFIAIAEEKNWIGSLTKLVFSKALEECRAILLTHPDFCLSLNLSVLCLDDRKLLCDLQQMIADCGVKPSSVAIEITESIAAHDPQRIAQIQTLRQAGHPIHLDDFGTGYSSLSYLHELNLDAIKIDKAFMQTIGTDAVQFNILPQILTMSQKLHLDVIVEGIETGEQEAYLSRISSTLLGQGWLYGYPVSQEQLRAMLAIQTKPE